jgi:hypothetical protein
MSKNINFTIGERVKMLSLFDSFKGNFTQLVSLSDDVKKVAISPDEWQKADRKIIRNEAGESWTWKEDDKTTWKDIELESVTITYLQDTIKKKSDDKEITLADVALISIQKKLQ